MSEARPGVPDEVALVRAVAGGSEDALATLYDRFAPAIFAAAARLTADRQAAEEVVQETFLALWNRAELFDPAAGSLAAWLHTIARNRSVDRLRAAGRRPRLVAIEPAEDDARGSSLDRMAGGLVIGGAGFDPDPGEAAERAELRDRVREALEGMPEPERTSIVLAYRDGLSQSEISERLGWPLGTVKTRTRRALLRLREALGPAFAPGAPPDEAGGTADGVADGAAHAVTEVSGAPEPGPLGLVSRHGPR